MKLAKSFTGRLAILAALVMSIITAQKAAAEEKGTEMVVAEGKLQLTAPKNWEKVKPRVNFIEYECAVPAAEGDENDGRVTVMGAGGSVEANIDRWMTQFAQPGGGDSKDKAKIEEKKVDGVTVHTVDVSGTFRERVGGPFAGGAVKEHKDYRMLAAIILTEGAGNYFVKFYGPAKTVAENEKAFAKVIEGLDAK